MAAADPKTWLMCVTLYATYTAAAVNNFFPTVVEGLGFSRNESYGLTAVSLFQYGGLELTMIDEPTSRRSFCVLYACSSMAFTATRSVPQTRNGDL